MLQRFIDAANQNLWVFGLVLCALFLIAVLILSLDNRDRKRMRKKIRQLKAAVETKESLIVHKDKEIWDLKVDLFRAKEDGKIALHKAQAEIDRLTARIAQLEHDKKQLSKWGSEK